MIQRVQTIYLFFAVIISVVGAHFLSVWKIGDVTIMVSSLKPFYFLTAISAVFSLIAVFLFKNRKFQFVLNRVNLLINLVSLGILTYRIFTMGDLGNFQGEPGLAIPFAVIILLVLANKRIKKEEQLIQSIDRIR